jgi:hypothetical protein
LENQEVSRLPKKIRNRLSTEAEEWVAAIRSESPAKVQELLDEAEPFEIQRPPRQPVSLHLDTVDIAMVKRFARQKGIPTSQLMALWLHERIEQEKAGAGEHT